MLRFARIHVLFEAKMRDLSCVVGWYWPPLEFVLSQSPSQSTEFEKGSVSGTTYTNPTLGITWELPRDWTIQNEGASLLGNDYSVLLHILPSGAQPQELIELSYSEKSGTTGQDSVLQSKGWQSVGHSGYYSLGGGIPAHRATTNRRANLHAI